jgi:hypothetical protein
VARPGSPVFARLRIYIGLSFCLERMLTIYLFKGMRPYLRSNIPRRSQAFF